MAVEQFRAYMRGALAFGSLVAYVALAFWGAPGEALTLVGSLAVLAFTFYYKKEES